MADVTSTLTTVLRVTGAGQMAATFAQMSQLAMTFAGAEVALAAANLKEAESAAATALAQQVLAVSMVASASTAAEMRLAMLALQAAEDAGIVASDGLAAANTALAASEWAVLGPIALIVLGIAAITAAIAVAVKGLQTFAEEQKAAFQAAVTFQNLGLSTRGVGRQIATASRETGFQRPELLEQTSKLAAVGVPTARIGEVLKAIGDEARRTGKSFSEVGDALDRGVLGKMRGLVGLQISLQGASTHAQNLNNIMREFRKQSEGASEAFMKTLPGATANFQRSLRDIFGVIGEKFAPGAIRLLNFLAETIDRSTRGIERIVDLIPPGMRHFLGLAGTGDNPIGKVGHGGDPATERTAAQIAENTKKMADSVEQAVLGGAGTEVRGAFAHLQARMAMAI